MLSAGGNDLFQNGNLKRLIEDVGPGQPAASYIGGKLDSFLEDIIADMRGLLLRVHSAFPTLLILMHGYAAAFSRMDRWIGKPLREANVMPQSLQNQVVKLILTKFNEAQITLARDPAFHGRVVHVDLRGLGKSADDWFDEIHLNDANNRAAADLFSQALRTHAPLSKATAELESGVRASALETDLPIQAIVAHAKELTNLDEAFLEAELTQRLDLLERDPESAGLPSSSLLVMSGGLEGGKAPAIGVAAGRLIRRWERELFDLLCDDTENNAEDRQKLREAWGLGNDALIGALAAWLVSGPLGVPALLAGVLAAILIKRFGGSAVDELCTVWRERLDGNG